MVKNKFSSDNEQAKNVQLRSVVGDVRIDNVTSSSDNNNQSMNCVSIEPNFEFQLTKSSCDRPISATFICEVQSMFKLTFFFA